MWISYGSVPAEHNINFTSQLAWVKRFKLGGRLIVSVTRNQHSYIVYKQLADSLHSLTKSTSSLKGKVSKNDRTPHFQTPLYPTASLIETERKPLSNSSECSKRRCKSPCPKSLRRHLAGIRHRSRYTRCSCHCSGQRSLKISVSDHVAFCVAEKREMPAQSVQGAISKRRTY